MSTVQIVAPVLIMLVIGVVCNKGKLISQEVVEGIKKFITTFPLPLTIFNAVSTATYNSEVVRLFVVMFIVVVAALLIGFLCKGAVKYPYRKYFPYLMTIYEGGMMAFPLYQSLMGEKNFSNIVMIDVPCGIFAFGIYFGMIKMTDQGTKINPKELIKNALSSPCFIALVLGLICGVSGIMDKFMATDVSGVYTSIKDMITAPLSAMILLCVGYEFTLERDSIGICLKTVFVRVIIQGALLLGTLFLAKQWNFSEPMIIGLILYFLTMPSLCVSSFVKNQDAGRYISTTSSLYLIITLITYVVLAAVI
ncbi:MAG: hypothetical protein E7258_07195 [Lachnospiraceae bacterium]|nr:hypothetical protein [Lachnospiraceae bacterium]